MPLNIAIMASGSGTNAQIIMDMAASGQLDVRVSLLFCNRPHAPVLERAARANVPHVALDHKIFPDRESFDLAALELLRQAHCELIVLAGYMRLLTPAFLDAFKDRIINIHPALLPAFPGIHGAADALAWGVKLTGATVHFVELDMDSGPPIIQAAVPVLPDDSAESLQNRIHTMEYRIYPQAIQWFARGRVNRQGRHVWISPGSTPQIQPEGGFFVWPPLEEGF